MHRKIVFVIVIVIAFSMAGCEPFRFAPTQDQKLNAWLHYRTAAVISDLAADEQSSDALCRLTNLNAAQSNVFLADYGLPDELPQLNSAADILSQQNWDAAWQVLENAENKPTGWDIADGAIELGIAIAGLFGGVYGLRFAGFLTQAKQKSQALKEIVTGNELFKKQHAGLSEAFKSAHQLQSTDTKQIVTKIKNSS